MLENREALTEGIIKLLEDSLLKINEYSIQRYHKKITSFAEAQDVLTLIELCSPMNEEFKFIKKFLVCSYTSTPEEEFYRILFGNPDENDPSMAEIEFIIKDLKAPVNIRSYLSSFGNQTKILKQKEKVFYAQSPIQARIWHACPSNENFENLSNIFREILYLNGTEKKELCEKLGRFYFYFNHSSVYCRGQASVGEWLVKAMAGINGYNLSWDSSWMAPNMSSSEHALLTFDEKSYISDFCEKSILYKRNPQN